MRKYFIPFIVISLLITALSFSQTETTKHFEKAEDHKAMIPIEVIRTVGLPKGYHEGLHHEDGYIWVNNGKGDNTWILDIKSGEVVSEITPVATFSEGITKGPEGKYWITDWDTKRLYRARLENMKMKSEWDISFAPSRPTGVVWTGEYLYVIIWTRGLGTKYHLIRMNKKGEILDKFIIKGIQEPSQLAWDGANLWISSWFQRRVYKIDGKTLEIKGYFRIHIEKTTGIAWDGEYLWITGTKSDLYQIKLVESSSI